MDAGFTADDLIEEARGAGHPGLSARTITDWVQRGLLDRPAIQSKGRAKGSDKALYPQAQRDLLLLLLDKRGNQRNITHLLVVPIGIWVYWGEEYVPTRQALRALTNWAKHFETASENRASVGVDGLMAQIVHPDAGETARNALRRTLLAAATSHKIPQDLSNRIAAVVDPHGEGRVLGLPGIPLQPEKIVGSWLGQRQAMRRLLARDVKPSALEAARAELRQTIAEYELLQPALAEAAAIDPYRAIKADAPSGEQLLQNAARDLLLPLAVVLDRRHL